MRITIDIDDELLDEVRRLAAVSGRTVGQVIGDGLRNSLSRKNAESGKTSYRVRPVRIGGTRPGVDLDDNAAVLDTLDDLG